LEAGSEPYCSIRIGSNGEVTGAVSLFRQADFAFVGPTATVTRRALRLRGVPTRVVEGGVDRCSLRTNHRWRRLITRHGVLHFAASRRRRTERREAAGVRRVSALGTAASSTSARELGRGAASQRGRCCRAAGMMAAEMTAAGWAASNVRRKSGTGSAKMARKTRSNRRAETVSWDLSALYTGSATKGRVP